MPDTTAYLLDLIRKEGGAKRLVRPAYAYTGRSVGDDTSALAARIEAEVAGLDAALARISEKSEINRVMSLLRGWATLIDVERMQHGKAALVEKSMVEFYDCSSLPQDGTTGGLANGKLRCVALFGLAVANLESGNSDEIVADKICKGFLADPVVAQLFMDEDAWKAVTNIYVAGIAKLTFVSHGSHVVPAHVVDGKVMPFLKGPYKYLRYGETYSTYLESGVIEVAAIDGEMRSNTLRIILEAGMHYSLEVDVNKPFVTVGGFLLGFVEMLDPRNLINDHGIQLAHDYDHSKRSVRLKENARERFVPTTEDFAKLSA